MSLDEQIFVPRWASPPGRSIRAAMNRRRLSDADLATAMGTETETITALIAGRTSLSPELAEALASALGSTSSFWITRFRQYDEDRVRIEADKWAQTAPPDLSSGLGWVPRSNDWLERIDLLLDFFGVPDIATWHSTYDEVLARTQYRTTSASPTNDIAVAAWLRRAQLQTDSTPLQPFDPDKFSALMADIRRLTWLRDPGKFLPQLTDLCARAGVAVCVVRAPRGCPASGATYITTSRQPLIILSGRFLSDDHLWFTFFHEAAHVLLHSHNQVHVDNLDPKNILKSSDQTEREADDWAASQILPAPAVAPRTYRQVQLLARQVGVAPGLLVGHFQHVGLLDYVQLNKAKRRYKWNGPSLETA